MTDSPFAPAGLAPNLIPNVPGEMPEAPGAGDAVAGLSPFKEALTVEEIFKNLILDRPLKLFIPNKEQYPQFEFRIINSTPTEIAAAHNKGFREVTDEKLSGLFADLVAGTDKDGKAFRPLLMARPKAVGDHIRKKQRQQLQSIYAGMDPKNKVLNETKAEIALSETKANFSGPTFRIRV